MYGEGGTPGTVPLHNLRVPSHVLHQDVPSSGAEYVSFEVFWPFLGAWGGARGRLWYGTFAKPTGHFTEGMFEKCRDLQKVTGKGKPTANPWVDTPLNLVPAFCAGCF